MANNAETARMALYADLQKFGQISDFERALKTANKILQSNPNDAKAFHFRVISLLQLSRFDDALAAFNKFSHLSDGLEFEKAYALYRQNKIEEALRVLETVENPQVKHNELKAQVLYRLERFDECFELYRDVIKATRDDFDEERQTNLSAIIVNLVASGKKIDMPSFEADTYEVHYNSACYLIAKGQYTEAEKRLKQAEKICRESFDDTTPAEEVEEEVSVIRLQTACCAHLQGRDREAMTTYTSILKGKPSDLSVLAVASNNSVAINRDQNLFDSKKKMKSILTDNVLVKLTSSQKRTISVNNCLLNILTKQGDQALSLCDELAKKHPSSSEIVALMKSAVLAREGQADEAINILDLYAKKNPESKLKMKLAVAQFLLNEGKVKEAAETLESLPDEDLFRPAIISAVVTMYMELGQPQEASRVLEKAVSWNRKCKTTSGDLSALWRHAADLHLRSGQAQIAAASLEELLKTNPNDVITLAQLVIAYAQFDLKKASELSAKLPHLIDLTPNMDAETLESSSWMMGLKVMKKAAKVDPSPGTPLITKKAARKNKKKKKKILPKNYNPNVDPDPERWLPRHERSTFRKKKDRRNKDIGKGTQGAAAGASDQYDMSKVAASQRAAAAQSPPTPSEGGPRQQRKGGGGGQQKKKKKGSKK